MESAEPWYASPCIVELGQFIYNKICWINALLYNPMTKVFPSEGGLGIFTDRDQRSIFLSFEFQKSVFLGALLRAAVFFGLLDKRCIFKCFIFLAVYFWLKFYTPGTSVITVFHYDQIVLNFCQINSVFGGYFLGFCFSESIFWVFCQWQSVFLGRPGIPSSVNPCL